MTTSVEVSAQVTSVEAFTEAFVEVTSVEASTKNYRGSHFPRSFHESVHGSVHGSFHRSFHESFHGMESWKLPRFHGSLHCFHGSFHGIFHELPPKMQIVPVAHEAPLCFVHRRTLLQPGVSSTLRKTRREVVASRESNLGYPKPFFGVDTKGLLTFGNFAVSLSCFFVKNVSLILFFFTSYEENTKSKNIYTSHRLWTVISLSSWRSTKDAFHHSHRLQAKDALQSLWAGPVPPLVWFAQTASESVSSGGEPIPIISHGVCRCMGH